MKNPHKIILEFSEFSIQRTYNGSEMGVQPSDPELSVNTFNKHADTVRNGIDKLNNIIKNLSNSNSYGSLKSKLALEAQNIKTLKILRIIKADNINYDVYVSFTIEDINYFGVIENILNKDSVFKSEVFMNRDLVQSKEWIIKTKGFIIKTIKKWLSVEEGTYKLLNEYVICNSVDTGKMLRLEKNTEIIVIRSYDNKIVIKYNDDFYNLINDNYVYFNYWFERK